MCATIGYKAFRRCNTHKFTSIYEPNNGYMAPCRTEQLQHTKNAEKKRHFPINRKKENQ